MRYESVICSRGVGDLHLLIDYTGFDHAVVASVRAALFRWPELRE